MEIGDIAFRVLQILQDTDLDDKRAREMALLDLEYFQKYCNKQTQTKAFLLEIATESKRTKFKLIARANTSGLELMEWCDDASNFSQMCLSIEDIKSDADYIKRTYSLAELPKVIDNALEWYNTCKKDLHIFNTTQLHILAVD